MRLVGAVPFPIPSGQLLRRKTPSKERITTHLHLFSLINSKFFDLHIKITHLANVLRGKLISNERVEINKLLILGHIVDFQDDFILSFTSWN